MFFVIIFICLLCPFVTAQVSNDNDYALEAFSGYIDVLINFMVPLLVFLIVDYGYESKSFVRLSRSLVFFINVAIQQEIAFIFSSFKVSNFVKILQHIVFGLLGIEIIGNFIIFLIIKKEKTEPNPLEILEKKFEKKFKGEIYDLKETLKKAVKTQNEQIRTFENSIKTQFQTLKTLQQTLEYKFKLQIQNLKKYFDESIQILEEIHESRWKIFTQFFAQIIQIIQILKQFFDEYIKTQIQTLENIFLTKREYEPKFQTLKKKVKTLEQIVDPSSQNKTPIDKVNTSESASSDIEGKLNKVKLEFNEAKLKFADSDIDGKFNKAKSEYDEAKSKLNNAFEENFDNTQELKLQEKLKLQEELRLKEELELQKKLDGMFQDVYIIQGKDDIFQEKDDIFQEKDDIIQGKDDIFQEKDDIFQGKVDEGKSSKNFNKEKIFIEMLRLAAKFTALTFFGIILCFLLNDLKENITQSFVMSSVISASLIFIIQFTILITAYRREKLEVYIEKQEIYNNVVSKYYAYFSIIEEFVSINVLYLPSLINYFLLQTPNIFNKIFLNLSALLVTVWIMVMYKSILKNEGMNEKKVEKKEKDNVA
ncbi:hypothetical protein RhiirA5_379423 [Rhizophagus irregularis]|uniref:Uncharacterized protein n=2 Tax=Rhizophagus irregularis TaxID=588596 RepID=A0A2I1EJV6_9GLOM|nr:hypothetical protein RirG_128290 [Rhizophagus irregularis DAOM 197198w]PKC04374.1 hypothetical protein RhiirA5_379423 [Rhizophagus irregularis]GBC15603.2 hypothetical protein GLOIN_2v1470416 [Rhizophagus irregularis DAOM 181602=DAOM 197198]PKC65881.1 hypothetical protein RhiirA1_513550 [Rhizophagus irregularis]PKY22395.1 hypothetical protein RhiirB3_386397 [Rhizophagus irregularis]